MAFDNGEQSRKAMDKAIELARIYKSKISIVMAINLTNFNLTFSRASALKSIDDSALSQLEGAMNEVAEKAKTIGIEVNTEVIKGGVPGESIVKYIDREKIDLAIIGSSNRSGLNKMFLGSVSSYIIQNAPCKVMIVR